ncbi:MAG: hypothetical protein Q7S80_00965 [bacterium]|nr:hypothetical protein [bacterium]
MMFISDVRRAAAEAVAKVIEVACAQGLLEADDTGGYFCLKMLGAEGFLVKPMLVGHVINGKDDRYIELCQEKATRLEARHESNGDVTSWQSRDPESDRWGGAILGPDGHDRQYAFSFSGLPDLCDEAVTLLTAVKVGHLSGEEALEIGDVSGSSNILVECLDLDGKLPETEGSR